MGGRSRCFNKPTGKFKAVFLLDALMENASIEIDGYKWMLDPGDNRLGMIGYNLTFGEDVLLINDLSLSAFIGLAERLTDEEMTSVGFSVAMAKERTHNEPA
jgi:hypothetical protein